MKNRLIRFTKMHGLGNDFVIVNAIHDPIDIKTISISHLADRHIGIGFDQLLVIEPSTSADFYCRIYNADGSEAEQCGNGLRCVARFIHETGLIKQSTLRLETKAGIFPLQIKDYDHIHVTLGIPEIHSNLMELQIEQDHRSVPISVLSVGNPHAIMKVDTIDKISTNQLGNAIATHAFFPHGANVGFMEVMDSQHIRLRTFERGVGETNACGSNACAAAVAGIANGWLKEQVRVEFRYGSLMIKWKGGNAPIEMIGPAAAVFSGEIEVGN